MKKALLATIIVIVSVATVFAGSATISWNAPTTYDDGTALPLSDLSYVIGYGLNSRGTGTTYPHNVSVPTPNVATPSYSISSLTTGTWYFAVKAVSNTYGTTGPWSVEVSKVVPGTPGAVTNVTVVILTAS